MLDCNSSSTRLFATSLRNLEARLRGYPITVKLPGSGHPLHQKKWPLKRGVRL